MRTTPKTTTVTILGRIGWVRAFWALAWAAFGGVVPAEAGSLIVGTANALAAGRWASVGDLATEMNRLLLASGRPDRVYLSGGTLEWCGRQVHPDLPGCVRVDTVSEKAEAYGTWPELVPLKMRRQQRASYAA